MENLPTNEEELTSTMGNLLSTNKDEKTDSSDSTPTSSTDASTTTTTAHLAADDPISSTSSDLQEVKKKSVEQGSSNVSVATTVSSFVSEKDLLDMNITDTMNERITENVDDIVQDLENLLGEPTTSFTFAFKGKTNLPDEEHKVADIDAFSAELQQLQEQTNAPSDNIESQTFNENDSPPKTSDISSIPLESGDHEVMDTTEINTDTIEKIDNKEIENCQYEIISGSTATTSISVEKSELVENEEVSSTVVPAKSSVEEKIEEKSIETITEIVEDKEEVQLSSSVEENVSAVAMDTEDATPQQNELEDVAVVDVLEKKENVENEKEICEAPQETGKCVEETVCEVQELPVEDVSEEKEQEIEAIPEIKEEIVATKNVLAVETKIELNEIENASTDETENDSTDEIKNETHEIEKKSTEEIKKEIDKTDNDLTDETIKEIHPTESASTDETKKEIDETENVLMDETKKEIDETENVLMDERKKEIDETENALTDETKKEVHPTENSSIDETKKEIDEIENALIDETKKEIDDTENVSAVEIKEEIGDKGNISTDETKKANVADEIKVEVYYNTENVLKEEEESLVVESATEDKEDCKQIITESEKKEELILPSQECKQATTKVEEPLLTEKMEVDEIKDSVTDTVDADISIISIEAAVPTEAIEIEGIKEAIIEAEEVKEETLSEDIKSETRDTEIKVKVGDAPQIPEILPILIEDLTAVEEDFKDELKNDEPKLVDEISSIEVLNAISSLNEEVNVEPEVMTESLNVEQQCETVDSESPTIEMFSEPIQSTQDDNLETLLAVASLENSGFTIASVETVAEDFTSPADEIANLAPEPTYKEKSQNAEEIKEPQVLLQESKIEESVKTTPPQDNKLSEPLVINIEDTEKEKVYSPKITIKPIKPPEEGPESIGENENKGSLKITITKQSDNTHSILKIYNPEEETEQEPSIPKLIIKPLPEQPQSPKTRSTKVFSPSSNQRSSSPRITIKPIPKPEESVAPLKITIKPVLKPEEKQKHSPKLTIKPIPKPADEENESKVHSPRVTIKPIKPPEEELLSPRITIKPIMKPGDSSPEACTPRVTIKPVVKPSEVKEEQMEKSSPKITIKPIVKPPEVEITCEDVEDLVKERIVLKINKGNLPGTSKEEKSEKLAKIKLKFSKEGGHAEIVQNLPTKRSLDYLEPERSKRQRSEDIIPSVTLTPLGSKLKEMLSKDKIVTIDDDDDIAIIEESRQEPSPIVISEESNQDSISVVQETDPLSGIPVFEISPHGIQQLNQPVIETPPPQPPAPRKRGRPRKVPLQVREDFKDPKEDEVKPVVMVVESTRPKRSCRGQSVRATLGIKPRKPRGPGRGRGSKRGMGTRCTPTREPSPRAAKELKLSSNFKEVKDNSFLLSEKIETNPIEILDDSPKSPLLGPPQHTDSTDRVDIVMYEEETRMSADTSSRAQTPAKQVIGNIPTIDLVEESQSSVQSIQSTATTESVKVRKGPRLEVHQEPDGAVISADQLAEYYWMGGGPFMLQEQVAQFLGIKSFKRKYPNIARRVVDMQERDFIRESGLASEAMCDLGLTAVNSSDILDIMYSDFQDKYEEYCKHQRDRQAKEMINKQRALTLAASQEKAKMDITQQAVQSAANWNANFNKTRRDQRKSCMDLQTLTIQFPKGKMKQINKPKVGYYPVALVPGQFTDSYREFTPTELNNLPLNTLCYETILKSHELMDCESQTDGSGSDSDSSTSDSDSSYSGSSDEDCTLCNKTTPRRVAAVQ